MALVALLHIAARSGINKLGSKRLANAPQPASHEALFPESRSHLFNHTRESASGLSLEHVLHKTTMNFIIAFTESQAYRVHLHHALIGGNSARSVSWPKE